MLRVVKFIFLILFLSGIVLAVYIFKSLTARPDIKLTSAQLENNIKVEIPQEKRWFSNLKSAHQDFAYPATEVEFSVNFQDGRQRHKDQIIIPNIDEETFFCLREILKEQNMRFAYKKTQDSLDIVLYLHNNQQEQLLSLFDYYGIHYSKN